MAVLKRLCAALAIVLALSLAPTVAGQTTAPAVASAQALDASKCKPGNGFYDFLNWSAGHIGFKDNPWVASLCAGLGNAPGVGAIADAVDVGTDVAKDTKEAVDTIKDPLGKLAKSFYEGFVEWSMKVNTLWMKYKVDDVLINNTVHGVGNIVYTLTGLAMIGALIAISGQFIIAKRQGISDGLIDIGALVGRYLIFSMLVPSILIGGLIMSDRMSDWILGFADTDAVIQAPDWAKVVTVMGMASGAVPAITIICLALIGLLGSLMQWIALLMRLLMVPIAAGLAPTYATLAFTGIGRSGLQHLVGMMIAAVAFKPVSALLYVVSYWWATTGAEGGGDDLSMFIGITMMAIAGFTAPTLVRAIAPVVAQAGGGSAGKAMGAIGSAAGAAVGAVALAASGGTAAAAGSKGFKKPTGSDTSTTTGGGGGGLLQRLFGGGETKGGPDAGSGPGAPNGTGPTNPVGPAGGNESTGADGGGQGTTDLPKQQMSGGNDTSGSNQNIEGAVNGTQPQGPTSTGPDQSNAGSGQPQNLGAQHTGGQGPTGAQGTDGAQGASGTHGANGAHGAGGTQGGSGSKGPAGTGGQNPSTSGKKTAPINVPLPNGQNQPAQNSGATNGVRRSGGRIDRVQTLLNQTRSHNDDVDRILSESIGQPQQGGGISR